MTDIPDVDYDELPKRSRSRSRDTVEDNGNNGGTIYVANLNYKVRLHCPLQIFVCYSVFIDNQ